MKVKLTASELRALADGSAKQLLDVEELRGAEVRVSLELARIDRRGVDPDLDVRSRRVVRIEVEHTVPPVEAAVHVRDHQVADVESDDRVDEVEAPAFASHHTPYFAAELRGERWARRGAGSARRRGEAERREPPRVTGERAAELGVEREPPGSGDRIPAELAEQLLRAVRGEREPDGDAKEQEPGVHGSPPVRR